MIDKFIGTTFLSSIAVQTVLFEFNFHFSYNYIPEKDTMLSTWLNIRFERVVIKTVILITLIGFVRRQVKLSF